MVPVPGSGSGWIAKEDLETDTILAQLKTTDKTSYKLNLLDIEKLEYHSAVTHKTPVFLIQFLKKDRLYALVDIELLSSLLPSSSPELTTTHTVDLADIHPEPEPGVKIKSSSKARKQFYKEKEDTKNGRTKSRKRR